MEISPRGTFDDIANRFDDPSASVGRIEQMQGIGFIESNLAAARA